MTRIVIQKHCEVLDVTPDPLEKDTYDVRVLLTKDTEEFSPEIPLKLKGTPQDIAKILTFLGEHFNQSNSFEHSLEDLSIAPLTFELKEEKVSCKDVHGVELAKGTINEDLDVAKVSEFSRSFFSRHKPV